MKGQLQKFSNSGQWSIIALLIVTSTYALSHGLMGENSYRSSVRLSPASIHLDQDPSNPRLFTGLLPLTNRLGGRVTKLRMHTGCKCTVVDKAPNVIDEGNSCVVRVNVENSNAAKQHVLLDFEVVRWDDTVPVAEVVTLEWHTGGNIVRGVK